MLSSDKEHQKAPWVGFNGGYCTKGKWLGVDVDMTATSWCTEADTQEKMLTWRPQPRLFLANHQVSPGDTFLFNLEFNVCHQPEKLWIKHALSSCQTASTFFVLKHKVKKSFGPWNSFSVQADIEVSDASSQRYQNPLASGLQFTEKLVLV